MDNIDLSRQLKFQNNLLKIVVICLIAIVLVLLLKKSNGYEDLYVKNIHLSDKILFERSNFSLGELNVQDHGVTINLVDPSNSQNFTMGINQKPFIEMQNNETIFRLDENRLLFQKGKFNTQFNNFGFKCFDKGENTPLVDIGYDGKNSFFKLYDNKNTLRAEIQTKINESFLNLFGNDGGVANIKVNKEDGGELNLASKDFLTVKTLKYSDTK